MPQESHVEIPITIDKRTFATASRVLGSEVSAHGARYVKAAANSTDRDKLLNFRSAAEMERLVR